LAATLTFDDEFNSLNWWNGTSGTWDPEYPYNTAANGGSLNDEQEWYINPSYAPTASVKPWTINNGVLSLTGAPAPASIQPYINNYKYTSGMITTFHSFSQTYGYFEIRAELPAGQGTWPAFWLLPADQTWPPEIDVFEMLGKDPTTIYTTAHTGPNNTSIGHATSVPNTSTGFHTYGVDWEPDFITWYFDGQQIFQTATPADMINRPMYLLANLSLGGGWPGPVDSTTPFPAQFQIDYIRAYASGGSSSPPPDPPPPPPPIPPPSSGGGSGQTLTADVMGGTLTGGAGDDTLIAGQGATTMTGGAGSDTFVFGKLPWGAGHITDFTPGVDKIDIHLLLEAPYSGTNPVADGLVNLVSDGAGGTQVYFNTTTFQWPWLVTTLDNVSPSSLSAGDWIVSAASSSPPSNFVSNVLWQNDNGQAVIWEMSGLTPLTGSFVGGNPGPSWHVKGSGDFNGDGNSDILWQNDSGQAAIWLMNGLTQLSGSPVGGNPGPSWHVVGAGDFNGDGKADILWQNDSGQAAIWLMNGLTQIGGSPVGGNPGSSWHVIGSGDFNGDGKADILWQNDNGQAAIWLMDGFTLLSGSTVGGNPGPSWHVKAAGDFNGDGKSDILWQNDDGQAAIWLMNGLTELSGSPVGGNPGPTWHVKGAGDFNGDGMADILWQNDDGQPAIWTMNGLTQLGGGAAGSNPGASWHALAMSA